MGSEFSSDHGSDLGMCHGWVHDDLGGLHYHQWPQWAAAKGHVYIRGPIAARVCHDVSNFYYHWRLCGCPGYGLISEAMLVPPGPYRLGWTALPPGAMETFGPRLQRRAVLWSMTPLHASKDCVYVHGSCAPFTTESSAENRTLDQNLRPCWCLKVVQPQWRLRSEYPESNLWFWWYSGLNCSLEPCLGLRPCCSRSLCWYAWLLVLLKAR